MLPDPLPSPSQPTGMMPEQDSELVNLMVQRIMRAEAGHQPWAKVATECFDFNENKQWSDADIAELERQGRSPLTINLIAQRVNLVCGVAANIASEIAYLPADGTIPSAETAGVLTMLSKQVSEENGLSYVDKDVFQNGIIGGRGFWDFRLNFERNINGDIQAVSADPFSTFLDPDAMDYDLNRGQYVYQRRWVSPEEVLETYGAWAFDAVKPLTSGAVSGTTPWSSRFNQETAPWRSFAGDRFRDNGTWAAMGATLGNMVDPARKSVALIDCQHYVRVPCRCFVDGVTGAIQPIPSDWDEGHIAAVMEWSAQQGNPLSIVMRKIRKVRWTQMAADVVLYDGWSPYETFTLVPFFPYFRQGRTKGIVENALGTQREINVARSRLLDNIGRQSHSGWLVAEGALDDENKEALETRGSRGGVVVEHNRNMSPPQQILPPPFPVGIAERERMAQANLPDLMGVNNAMMGNIDTVQSARSLENRQKQSITGLAAYFQNWSRSKKMCGEKQLEIIRQHYTSERMVSVTDDNGDPVQQAINVQTAQGIVHDVTQGKYKVVVNDTPLSKTFNDMIFEDLLDLLRLGVPVPPEFLVENSSIPGPSKRRIVEGIKQREQAIMQGAAPDQAAQAAAAAQVKPGVTQARQAKANSRSQG